MGSHICSDCGGTYVAAPGGYAQHVNERKHTRTLERKRAEASGPENDLDKHVRIQNQIQMLGQLALGAVTDDELDAFIDACERSDTIAPFLDPTAWMRGRDQLRQVIDHARALQRFRKELRR